MVSRGGARSRSGAAPDPNALKRDYDRREWIKLPKQGCTLDIPEWPDEFGVPSMRELAVWTRLWQLPQAIVWHNDNALDMVVVYVRALLQASQPKAGPGVLASFRQYSEVLLLTSPALRSQRYFIQDSDDDAVLNPDLDAPMIQVLKQTGTEGADVVRGRFKVLRPQDDEDDEDDDDDPSIDD